jgi:hypothetical protein
MDLRTRQGTTPGGIDGFLAQLDASGTRTWTEQIGTTADPPTVSIDQIGAAPLS